MQKRARQTETIENEEAETPTHTSRAKRKRETTDLYAWTTVKDDTNK